MLERVDPERSQWFCSNCSHDWRDRRDAVRFRTLDDLVARTGLRRDEVVTLADIGALNGFGYDRRSALWQAERAVRPSGELFENDQNAEYAERAEIFWDPPYPSPDTEHPTLEHAAFEHPAFEHPVFEHPALKHPTLKHPAPSTQHSAPDPCPLKPMTEAERLVADYGGTGLTIGRHPMALRRDELALRGILRARDLATMRHGRRVRVAGMVITRQRPGTAKGFVFLTLEDETGIANIIVRPDLFARDRLVVIEEPFLIVEGVMQHQDGVLSVRAEQLYGLRGIDVDFDAHDFY